MFYHNKKREKPIIFQSEVNPFTFVDTVDMSSIKYQLAQHAGMDEIESKHGIAIMSGDKIAIVEYWNLCEAHKKEIQREFMARYKP